jgi:hypothetical protein
MMMNEQKYLPEYELLKTIPNDKWLLFVTLTYGEPPPPNKYTFRDVRNWLENVSRTLNRRPEQLVWFARIEDVEEDGFQVMPRHVHLCVHQYSFDSLVNNTNLKLWTPESLKLFLEPKWIDEHGGNCLILKYDPTQDGVGYCLKEDSKVREVFVSKGLKGLLDLTNFYFASDPI